jgi:Flp pilus assembly protein TadG
MTMMKKDGIVASQQGATMVVVGVIFLLLVMVTGVVVDMGRVYVVHAKAQNAADASLMGAVATVNTAVLEDELNAMFAANYPLNYMGSTVGAITVTEVSPNVYEATFPVTVPSVIMQIFGRPGTSFTIVSQVVGGFSTVETTFLELALVLDNTGSMCIPNCSKLDGLKQASKDLVDILFGADATLPNIHISVIPYDAGVDLGVARSGWIQAAHVPQFTNPTYALRGQASNRNPDAPSGTQSDLTDDAPTTEELKFRLPRGNLTLAADGGFPAITFPDNTAAALAPISFAFNDKALLHAEFDKMIASGYTRINVGLMWGWFTLSPKWQGLWDAGKADMPRTGAANVQKQLVLMTDGENTVYLGQRNGTISNDNTTTAGLCTKIKEQGITIYTVGFGANVNSTLLQNCASQPSYYFFAPTPADLRTAFRRIADIITQHTLRLSK